MSDQKKSIDGLKNQQTDTDEVKGGFNPRSLKPSQSRTSTEPTGYHGRDEARPIEGEERVHIDRNFRK